MKRRLVAAVVAVALAGIGALLLMGYVAAADRRAMAGMETVRVLVVTKPVAEGTSADALRDRVAPKLVPAMAAAPGAVVNLTEIRGKVATASLQPGEQLLASRFVDPATLEKPGTVKVPPGLQEVSLALDPQRVVGGNVTPGAAVGVFISLPAQENRPAQTSLVLQQVLVTKVQGGVVAAAPQEDKDAPPASAAAPQAAVLITLATTAEDAQKLVFAAENAKVWLSLQPANTSTTGVSVLTEKGLYR